MIFCDWIEPPSLQQLQYCRRIRVRIRRARAAATTAPPTTAPLIATARATAATNPPATNIFALIMDSYIITFIQVICAILEVRALVSDEVILREDNHFKINEIYSF